MQLPPRLLLLPAGLVLLLLAVSGLVQAQNASDVRPTAPEESGSAEQIYALLDETLAKAQTLRLPENRIRFQTTAACLLWPHDEQRARAILKENMNALAALIAPADSNDPQVQNQTQAYRALRFELVRMVARRDAKLALNFLRATRQERPANSRAAAAAAPDQELALELTLAADLADTDAQEAAHIGAESLRTGTSAELLNVLSKLRAADREAAARLATDVIKRLQAEDLSSDGEATIVAAGLLNLTRPTQTSVQADSVGGAEPTNGHASIMVAESVRRDLINAIVAGVVRLPANRMSTAHLLFNSLPAIMPEVEHDAPEQLLAVRAKMQEFRRSLDPTTKAWQSYEGLRQQGSVDALLEAALKAPPEVGDELYADAAFKVLESDDPERARQIIDKIADPQRRALKSKLLEQQLLERALMRGKLEDAGQRLPAAASVEERFSALLYLANLAIQRKESALARRFLSEALELVGGRVQNGFQFSAQLQIARAFALVQPKQSFAILDDLAGQLNDLLNAAAVVDGFGPDCFKDGELKPFVGNMWGELVKQYGEVLAALAPQNVDHALSVAQSFQRDEVRVLLALRVAERVLAASEMRQRGHLSGGAL